MSQTAEQRRAVKNACSKRWYQAHKEEKKRASREWALANPDRVDASLRRSRNKTAVKRIVARAKRQIFRNPGSALAKQIAHHVAKGRDTTKIMIMMGLPASVVAPLVEQARKGLQC
jgi:hypothetical protein